MRSNKGKRSSRERNIQSSRSKLSPPASVLQYTGPLTVPGSFSDTDTITRIFNISAFLTSSATGVIQNVYSSDPTVDTDFASMQNLYSEYRVLVTYIEYSPNYLNFLPATVLSAPIYITADRQTNTPLANYAQALGDVDCLKKTLMRPWKKQIRMSGILNATYGVITGAPAFLNYIKLFSTGLSNSTTYGNINTYHLVQFRAAR